ncbi:MAG: sialidase [Chitinophagaceae bacterium]|nr:sialidase [Chitinophagaceae bacterium]
MTKKTLCLLPVFVLAAFHIAAQAQQEPDSVWQKIQPYFSPPAEYAGKYGDYRSPLKFYDGREVKTPADWKKRRKEIFRRWNDMMGHWPRLIKKPAFAILDSVRQEGYTRYHIEYSWRREEKAKGYLLVPDEQGVKPAVVTVFYEPETAVGLKDPITKPYRDLGVQLAKRGFVVFSTGISGASPVPLQKPFSQYYPSYYNAEIQPLSMLAYLAANAYNLVANLPYVDPKRVGVTGHSYGGKWSMFASCLYEKYACGAWSDLGVVFDDTRSNVNYDDPWYLGYYPPPWSELDSTVADIGAENKGLYPKLRREGYDLHELHALMAPRPFLVSGGSEDRPERWVPLNHAIALNKFLGYENRVAMTNRPTHAPNPESNEQLCLFFEHFLKYNGITKKK